MDGNTRRKEILDCLDHSEVPVSGTELAEHFDVSRQVIVQDIALLRAHQHDIISTNNGYVLVKEHDISRIFKVKHTEEQIEDELTLIVDLGGWVEDVFVYHKVYDVIRAVLNIKSRRDVKEYLNQLHCGISTPLMRITSEYHYHTVKADSVQTLELIEEELRAKGYLAELREYEPAILARDAVKK